MARYVGLFSGVVCVLVMAVLAVTPLAWQAMGRPDETYPEMAYMMFGMPLAIVSLVAGINVAYHGAFTRRLKTVQYIQWAACVLLLLAALSPWLS
ncbi:hypothetical protein OE766_05715 [Pararhizobium sp. YC-54]|uniref:hypothetical protein n=1 Tax=Pararhizobium sp. YC-54 TaxID=2986920 RepID=UPI0021F6AA79|nr:hypothetical protein [Pararhizobium sp. YC-54]MCV9997737.1 hypothetical protein [Pararhizobium sp. YC-54]